MKTLWASQALTPEGWRAGVRLTIGADGRIASVETEAQPQPGDHRLGILLPAPLNAHSHAFQRAMAGLTERRGPDPRDSFWTWRKLMFRFLDQLTPEDVEDIAAFVQMEMLEAGYAAQAEFHYLHHAPGGTPYADLAEMSGRIAAAAARTGIGLTLLPVLYQYGGCDKRPLAPGQNRFGNDLERFARLHEGAAEALGLLGRADSALGAAPHSLRAVDPESLAEVVKLAPQGPIHMHLAEQVAEVEEVEAALGARPVTWLLANAEVDSRWTLIHCTQTTPEETLALAASGATAGLCPLTESSLGDGIFDGVRYLGAGGRFAIGSDSNIRIALSEELRTLDYSQRLRDRSRAALATAELSTGRVLYEGALKGGAAAGARESGALKPGLWADLLALDAEAVDLIGRSGDAMLDTWIFAGDDRLVKAVWAAGRHVVSEGRHKDHAAITARYAATMRRLKSDF